MKVTDTILLKMMCGNSVADNIALMYTELDKRHWAGEMREKVENVETDYRCMCDFFLQGYHDTKADSLYRRMLERLYGIAVDMFVADYKKTKNAYRKAWASTRCFDRDVQTVRHALEQYVQDAAMLTFESDSVRKEHERQLHIRHNEYSKQLFDSILVSGAWTPSHRKGYTELLLSPTIDTGDALLAVSALTLSLLNVFDLYKWIVLVDVYMQSTSTLLAQRALVGWVLALPQPYPSRLNEELDAAIERLAVHSALYDDLTELQKQLMFCCKADSDTAEIQNEIIPKLMKDGNFKVTRLGIEETDDNPMDDILGTGENDRRMEEMEATFRKMQQMQKEGSDVFFGGFSQMKRFPFFNDMCNWFCAYSPQHPLLYDLYRTVDGSGNFSAMLSDSPFCDSDKYSFVLAFSSVMHRLPAHVRDGILNNKMAFGPAMMNDADKHSATYTRRIYLQNLYRFFRLNNDKDDFPNPFNNDRKHSAAFMSHPLMRRLLGSRYGESLEQLARFLYAHKMFGTLEYVMQNTDNCVLDSLRAKMLMQKGCYAEAYALLKTVADNRAAEDVLACKAHCAFCLQEYTAAIACYRLLCERFPSRSSYCLKLAVCLLSDKKVDDALALLYKLDFENPDNGNVSRALAWALLLKEEPLKALARYDKLLERDSKVAADFLNGGYALWLSGNVKDAAERMARYCGMTGSKELDGTAMLDVQFAKDHELFSIYGINMTERQLMKDIVSGKCRKQEQKHD